MGVKKKNLVPYFLIAPSMILFAIFFIYPLIYMVYLSLFDWNMMGSMKFVGIANFKNMFTNPEFWQVFSNTLIYTLLSIVLTVGLALAVASYIKGKRKINSLLQVVVFSPYIMPAVTVAFIWSWMLDPNYGLINYLLSFFGVAPYAWLQDTTTALPILVLIGAWKSLGYNALVIVSAMNAIPKHLYEAAELDHAKKSTVFFKIVIPMISPTLFFLVLVNMIASLKTFETIKLMTLGGPQNTTKTLVYYLYENGFNFYKIGYASAIGVVLMIFIGVLSLLYFKVLDKKVYYN